MFSEGKRNGKLRAYRAAGMRTCVLGCLTVEYDLAPSPRLSPKPRRAPALCLARHNGPPIGPGGRDIRPASCNRRTADARNSCSRRPLIPPPPAVGQINEDAMTTMFRVKTI